MALWELDEFKPATFLGFIRSVPVPNQFVGTNWLPTQTIDDLEFKYILGANKRPVMAHVMGFDSEAPIHGRPGLGESIEGELPPIKRKAKFSEKEIIRFLTPRSGTADIDRAINSVYELTGDLLDAVQARLEWLRMQALSEDKIVYNEGGVIFQFDYGLTDAYQIDLVTGTDGAGNSLVGGDRVAGNILDPTFAILPWLQYLVNKIQVETGQRPRTWVASAKAQQSLIVNETLRELIRGTGAGVSASILTQNEINALFSLYDLPTVTPYDVHVMSEQANGTYVDIRTMAENKSFFLAEQPGNTLLGPTAESRVLYGTPLAAAAPGVWAETYGTTEPPSEWVKAAAVGFPTMPGANKIGQMKLWAD